MDFTAASHRMLAAFVWTAAHQPLQLGTASKLHLAAETENKEAALVGVEVERVGGTRGIYKQHKPGHICQLGDFPASRLEKRTGEIPILVKDKR